VVINGRGRAFAAVVVAPGAGAAVRLERAAVAAPEPRVAVTLAQAVLKSDKMDAVVRDAVMMGVTAVQPVVTARSEVTRASLERGRRRERWERIAIASAKQCGRAVVPTILDPMSFEALPAAITAMRLPAAAWMLAEPGASTETLTVADVDAAPPREATLVIGPEGGWTAEEVAAGASACRLLTLGGRTLRADAAAVVAMAALFTRWSEF
jgi:16S rRNA (uracil1498-N3)-methyltransferase